MAITIDGKKYKTIEDMGYQHSFGFYAKCVKTDDGEKIVIKRPGGKWQFNPTGIIAGINPVPKMGA